MNKRKRIEELTALLLKASDAYYNKDAEIMSDYQYDQLFDELVGLEEETGIILPNSPTQRVGMDISNELQKVEHEIPARSLDKTKSRETIKAWLKDKIGCLSWKMDGLTVIATYLDGKLVKAETRGNGFIGEDVTFNAKNFKGLPLRISYKGKLIVRGEVVMHFDEFERINKALNVSSPTYKNPRNLASATVRLTDVEEAEKRRVEFYAFRVVYTDDAFITNSVFASLDWLADSGFSVVQHYKVWASDLVSKIDEMEKDVINNPFPTDGLVLVFDNTEYGDSLGYTAHHENSGLAFKWADEKVETTLIDIEWSASRTGLLNPVAVFKPVELEGTTVSRASVHNVSILRALSLSKGSKINVYKANMIIPQIAENVENKGPAVIPDVCPVCGDKAEIIRNDDVEVLYCGNSDCPAKKLGQFTHFCSRDAMNIEGLSEATLEKFISKGFLKDFRDIYHLDKYKGEIINMEGFGKKSYENLANAIEKSRNCKFSAFLTGVGIPGIGKEMARQISSNLGEDPGSKFIKMLSNNDDFSHIPGIGDVINFNIHNWYVPERHEIVHDLLFKELSCAPEGTSSVVNPLIDSKTFVITGSLKHFTNRDALKATIENCGGKVTGSVSAKTDYLINNDVESTSSKNKKAKELGVKIITEENFMAMMEEK